MPSRDRRKFPTDDPKTPAERACYDMGLGLERTDEMPTADSPYVIEWICHELGAVAVNAASYIGWRHVWWWVNRGRQARATGHVVKAMKLQGNND